MSGSHQDLHVLTHSFPTRRSSDLDDADRCRRVIDARNRSYQWRNAMAQHLAPFYRHLGHTIQRRRRSFADGRAVFALNLANAKIQLNKKRSEEHPSELQSLMRISYAVLCLKKKTRQYTDTE